MLNISAQAPALASGQQGAALAQGLLCSGSGLLAAQPPARSARPLGGLPSLPALGQSRSSKYRWAALGPGQEQPRGGQQQRGARQRPAVRAVHAAQYESRAVAKREQLVAAEERRLQVGGPCDQMYQVSRSTFQAVASPPLCFASLALQAALQAALHAALP